MFNKFFQNSIDSLKENTDRDALDYLYRFGQ